MTTRVARASAGGGRVFRAAAAVLVCGLALSAPAQVAGRLSNLSARGIAGRDADALTAGFVIEGGGARRLLVRAAGPSLASFGVSGVLGEARLELYRGDVLINANAGWDRETEAGAIAQAADAVGAFAFPPQSSDAALYVALTPGNYTARVVPARDGIPPGVALVEVYDADPAAAGRLLNLSARARSGSAGDALIVGFTVAGEARNRLLVRAAGGALARFGVAGALGDPQLEIFRGSTSLAYNDDWEANTNAAHVDVVTRGAGAFAFSPGARDAALLLPAAHDGYTAVVTGTDDGSGVALLEVYDTATVNRAIPERAFHLVGFGRVPGHGTVQVTGGGTPTRPYNPQTRTGDFWRIDEATAAAADFPVQFRAALSGNQPLVVELDAMLDLSRVASPSNGPTAIAHPDLLAAGQSTGRIGLLALGSNKTIYSAFGAGGFRRGTLRIDGQSNIVLRNLRFRELWEWDDATAGQYDRNDWDYLTIISRFRDAEVTARTHHIWIDHCDFEKAYDGLFDIVQGSDLVTVSWCKIAGVVSGETQRWVRRQMDYLEANQDRFPYYRAQRAQFGAAGVLQRELFQKKANLVGNATDPLTTARDEGHLNVTFHHNWYVHVDQRMPRMRFGNAHVFNLLADSSAGRGVTGLSLAAVAATSGAAVRVENAWFTGVRTPLSNRIGLEPPGTISVRNSVNFDPFTGAATEFDPQMIVPAAEFAWRTPAAVAGWPVADPAVMPAGYTPAASPLSEYLDPPEFILTHLEWVGVQVPANATEAGQWRARWQQTGP